MAEATHIDRPISPHLTVYRRELSMIMSIFHRMTGIGLAGSGILVVWWFLAAATSPDYFRFADWVLTSWIGTLVMIVSLASLWFHFFTGLRHLVWDTGSGFKVAGLRRSGITVLVAAGLMTVVTLIIAL